MATARKDHRRRRLLASLVVLAAVLLVPGPTPHPVSWNLVRLESAGAPSETRSEEMEQRGTT